LTLSTLLIAALLMVSLGVSGTSGVLAVLSVAAVVCVSSAVAGELLQDFKVGYILGGTPRRIQVAELIAVVVASLVMYFPLALLNRSFGFGSRDLAAPQAGLMATLAVGVVGGDMPWPLVVVGIFMGIGMIMMQVRSPMLVAVGMYLPFETTFAIFLGGVFRALGDRVAKRRGFNPAQMARVENAGVLTASGLIVGESLLGLVWAGVVAIDKSRNWEIPQIFAHPSYLAGLAVMVALAVLMIRIPLSSAGDPNEPAPPVGMM
jgi:putative OPT family oligopeptide transporter